MNSCLHYDECVGCDNVTRFAIHGLDVGLFSVQVKVNSFIIYKLSSFLLVVYIVTTLSEKINELNHTHCFFFVMSIFLMSLSTV